MKIQYISDIHLEFYEDHIFPKLIPIAPILCLAGDIGYPEKANYQNFLEYCSSKYKHIFIITGNHEYYTKTAYDDINIKIENIVKKYDNITFLNRKVKKIENYVFIGCTLWSHIPNSICNYELKVYNDLKKIHGMRREIYNFLHTQDKIFLEETLNKYENIICLTHHLPSPKLIHSKYKNLPYYMYASDLEYLIKDNIKLWICGHSHESNTVNINDVICTLNPLGYPNEHNIEYIDNSLETVLEI